MVKCIESLRWQHFTILFILAATIQYSGLTQAGSCKSGGGHGSINSVSQFKSLVKRAGNRLLMIEYVSPTCGPCRFITPVFDGLIRKYPCALIYKVNTDQAKDLVKANGITAMPTFHFYKNGNKVDELTKIDPPKIEVLAAKYI